MADTVPGQSFGHNDFMPKALTQTRELLDMIKFEHTVFALPFAFLAAMEARQGWPPLNTALWIVAAMVGARTAAMTFNRLVDADLDALNPRTAQRALPAGRVTRFGALVLLGLACALLGLAAGALNPLCWKLAPLALLIILGYSWCKRFTSLAHLVLGLALAGAPLGAWIALTGRVDPPAWWLALGVLCWTGGFDILYALQDQDFDRASGLHSIPSRLGTVLSLALSRSLHLAALAAWAFFNVEIGAHFFGWLGWLLVAGMLAREQWLVRGGNLERIDEAFFTLNSLVGLAFFGGHLLERITGYLFI